MKLPLQFQTRFKVEHYRAGKLIDVKEKHNLVTIEGLNLALDTLFNSAAQIANWYVGLISNASYTAVNEADVMNSHAGWVEFTSYDEATRREWLADAAASKQVTNSTYAEFTINASGTLKGAFITSNNTKSGTTGKLWSAGTFDDAFSVVDNDVLRIQYTVTLR